MFLTSLPRHLYRIHIQIYSKPNCCLCDQAEFHIKRMLSNMKFENSVCLEKINIEKNENLKNEFELTIPVILVNDKIVCESRIDIPGIRRAIVDIL